MSASAPPTLPEGDVASMASFRARLSHRMALHWPARPARLAPPEPVVSFTFDDAPVCSCTRGARLLEAYGARGTYYVAGGLIGQRTAHWLNADDALVADLHAAGHEIGSHTYGHAFVPNLSPAAVVAEARANHARLRAIVPDLEPESFAFPYGYASPGAKRALAGIYRSSRGIRPGLNRGPADLQLLRANPLVGGVAGADAIGRLMDAALARSGWLIFYGHDVVEDPSPYGCTPALLEAALRAAQERGIACLTVAEALRSAQATVPASLTTPAGRIACAAGALGAGSPVAT